MYAHVPYFIQEHYEFKSKNLLSSSILLRGWYIVNLLFSLTSNQTFNYLSQNQIKLETKDMIHSGWYRMYLNETQISFLLNSNLANLYPIIREKSILSESELYLVYASPDFRPPTNNYTQIDENLFILSNISLIRNDPRVLKISPHSRPILENRYAGGYSENLNEIPSYDNQGLFLIPRPLHQMGLTGNGQIVAVSDSGLDTHHCFFYDPKVPAPFRTLNANHRKIMLYDPVADDLDAERGHGTHVCGIIAGTSLCKNCGIEQYNGVAPGAKIYMHDLGDLRNGGGSIIDVNLSYYVERMRYASSFISSNSWGYSNNENEIRATFSKHAYENPDILFLFACGNSYSTYTIHTPSNSKNVLAIGALISPHGVHYESVSESLFYPSERNPNYETTLSHNAGPTVSDCFKANPSKSFYNKDVMFIERIDQINISANNSVVIIDNTQFIDSDACLFALNEIKNPSLIIFTKKLEGQCRNLNGSSINIPILCMTNSSINVDFLRSLTKVNVQPYYSGKKEKMGKLGLSSQGPSNLGYTKPEVVATGQNVLSARAGPPYQKYPRECDVKTLVTKSGTSMATPVASGIMSMVRQFFIDGWYPSCTKPDQTISNLTLSKNLHMANKFSNTNNPNSINFNFDPYLDDRDPLHVPFTPSSSMLRAFAVNSAQKISTMISTGFGVMNPYEGLGFTGIGLRVANHRIINSNEHHIFKIIVTSSGSPLSVTLSYLDPPLPAQCSVPLFADLDLVVITPNGKTFKGNGFENKLDEDQFASTEKVIINKAAKGEYKIHVLSSTFSMPKEVPYSIVVNGKFKQTDFSTNPAFLIEERTNSCYASCKNGQCVNGICKCNAKYYGHSCNKKAGLSTLKTSDLEMNNKVVKYFLFKIINDKETKSKTNTSVDVFTIKFNNDNKYGIGYCFNFEAKTLKIADAGQECFMQTKSNQEIAFNSSAYPSIKPGNYISMSLYAITSDYSYVDFTVSGVETHFSIVFWFIHLPLWMMITVASSVGLVLVLISIILMLLFCKPPKKKKKKNTIVTQIDENPNPPVMDHDPNDNISIDENLL